MQSNSLVPSLFAPCNSKCDAELRFPCPVQFKFPLVDAKLMDGPDGVPIVEVPLDGEGLSTCL